MKMSRRNALTALAMGSLGMSPSLPLAGMASRKSATFRFCLNTSTVSGKNPGLHRYVEIASSAGYQGIEIWVRDLEAALGEGHSLSALKRFLEDHNLVVENAIGFAPWIYLKWEKNTADFSNLEGNPGSCPSWNSGDRRRYYGTWDRCF